MIGISKVSSPEQLVNSSTEEGKTPNKLVVALETVILVPRVPLVAHTDPGKSECLQGSTACQTWALPSFLTHHPCVELPAPCKAPPRDELPSSMRH